MQSIQPISNLAKTRPSHFIRRVVSAATITLLVLFSNECGLADVVWVRDQPQPIYGKIIRQSKEDVEIRVYVDEKLGEVRRLPRASIDQLIVNIDNARLQRLTPSDAGAYRDYAEELSVQKDDPAARALAQRLYLIAAANANPDIRRSSLLGLIGLAASEKQRQRLILFQHLNDPESTAAGVFRSPESNLTGLTPSEKALALELVQAIRQERSEDAIRILGSSENRIALAKWHRWCELKELDLMARVNRPSKLQLSKLLAIELNARQSDAGSPISPDRNLNWGDYAMQVSNSVRVIPTIENITRFDPHESIYRDGQWVVPAIEDP